MLETIKSYDDFMEVTMVRQDNHPWWQTSVIYQIYPRSFFDTNNDGIGDLAGIVAKLDYLSDLGINAVWLSPVNQSPMVDFGYDVSDYRRIDPIFGGQTEFDTLLKEAHRRNIRIIMDLVVNHTSHEHPWFQEARASRDNPRRDWYIWHDGNQGRPPNNWKAAFGGNAWEWDDRTQQYYLHSFLVQQPDLNWRNADLRKAVMEEMRFWLDKGVDGFRLDVVNFFTKDDRLRNNPLTIGHTPRPYDLQKHVYDRNRPENRDVIRELRQFINRFDDRVLIGEVYTAPPGDAALSASYLGNGHDALHLAFDFSLLYCRYGARAFRDAVECWYTALPENAWPCNVLSNHDQPRSYSRYGSGNHAPQRAKTLAALLLTLKGTPFIYYGEEIGMADGKISKRDLQDPVGKKYWPLHKGRDRCRTPMQWTAEPQAGFSKGRPWLPVNPDYADVNVASQYDEPDSVLSFYKHLIALRHAKPALSVGDWTYINNDVAAMAYYRTTANSRLAVWLNFSRRSKTIKVLNPDRWQVLLGTHKKAGPPLQGFDFDLAPHEALILEQI